MPEHAGHIGDDDYYIFEHWYFLSSLSSGGDDEEENDDHFSATMIITLATGDMIAADMMLFIEVNAVTKWYYEE